MQKSGTDTRLKKRECRWKLGLQIYSHNQMKTNTLQVLAIALCFSGGFSLNSLLNGPAEDSPYYQDKSDLLQCTVNIDCDNHYDRGMFFPEEKIPQDMHLL